MIRISKEKDIIRFNGHSLPNICAAVSSVMYTTVNALIKYDNDCIYYEDNEIDDYVIITVKKHDDMIDLLIDNMFTMFNDIVEENENEVNIDIIR